MSKLLAIGAVVLLSACFTPATTPFMRPVAAGVTPGPLAADRARLVFIRPSGYVANLWATVYDEQGRYLGDALPQACFYADVEPGSHSLVAWTRPADTYTVLPAHLAPGKTYFVEVAIHMTAAFEMTSIVPELSSFANVNRWLDECRLHEVDQAAGQRALDAVRKGDPQRFVKAFDDATVEPGRAIRLADGH